MTIEHFLTLWNQYNTVIIEGLVGLIILLSLLLGYRSFFGKKSAGGELGAGGSLDTAQLEKTLQKILDAQGAAPKAAHSKGEDLSSDIDVDAMKEKAGKKSAASSDSGASAAEVEKLRGTVSESQKTIENLQNQLAEAQAQAMASQGAAPAAAAGAGMSAGEKEDFDAKIRDLESRLAEYEIISEDIADLSRYKDENESLRAELEAMQKAVAAAPAPAAAPAAEPKVEAPTPAAPVAAAAPEPTPEPAGSTDDMIEAALKEAAAQMAPEPVADAGGSELIDDELMKEFAAAVEGQKALDKVGEKAGSGKVAAEKKPDDNDQLMNEFENFVSKKS